MNKLLILTTATLLLGACTPSANKDGAQQADNTTTQTDSTLNTSNTDTNMKFELVQLPYAVDALAPIIGKRTIELHHGKHLQTYVDNLNKLIEGTPFAEKDLITIVKESEGGIFNNAGQNLNHILYFLQFRPQAEAQATPVGNLKAAIEKTYGSFEAFQGEFLQACLTLFGSGWAWLATDAEGTLHIVKEPNAGNPVTKGLVPLLGIDVWEHAYYVDYENRRKDHVDNVWSIIDWNILEERYNARKEPLNYK